MFSLILPISDYSQILRSVSFFVPTIFLINGFARTLYTCVICWILIMFVFLCFRYQMALRHNAFIHTLRFVSYHYLLFLCGSINFRAHFFTCKLYHWEFSKRIQVIKYNRNCNKFDLIVLVSCDVGFFNNHPLCAVLPVVTIIHDLLGCDHLTVLFKNIHLWCLLSVSLSLVVFAFYKSCLVLYRFLPRCPSLQLLWVVKNPHRHRFPCLCAIYNNEDNYCKYL